jgi:hypothetical protein
MAGGGPRRLGAAIAGGVAFALFTASSRFIPALHPLRLDIIVSMLVALPLMAVLLSGLSPLRDVGHHLLLVSVAALALAVVLTSIGCLPGANVAKAVLAASLGLWLAAQIDSLPVIAVVAVIAALADSFSVFTAVGPTNTILTQHQDVVPYFAVALAWFGYSYRDAYSAIGTSDLIFFSIFLGAALRFRLRVTATVVAMTVSLLVTVAVALWARALPALPLLSAAFLLTNVDLIWRRPRGAGARA